MSIIKENVHDFAEDHNKRESLDCVPQLMTNITGALHVLQFNEQANLSQAISDYMFNELINKKEETSDLSLDLLADAIIGLENFFQAILEEAVTPEIGLAVAENSITTLGYAPNDSRSFQDFSDLPTVNDVVLAGN